MNPSNLPDNITILNIPVKANSLVGFVCSEHGKLTQVKRYFLKTKNCFKCLGRGFDTSDFIKEFNKKHNFKYKYEKGIINKRSDIISISCSVHGIFNQKVQYHLGGSGCPKCVGKNLSIQERIEVIKKKYPQLTILTIPAKIKEEVEVKCTYHGKFISSLYTLKSVNSCYDCRYNKAKTTRINSYNISNAINLCKEKHNNKYNYSLIEKHLGVKTKVAIICPIHGIFNQMFYSHLAGHGCPTCGYSFGKAEKEILMLISDSILRDRKLIKPYELDILTYKSKLGIEYNGIMWHSFGISDCVFFDNSEHESKQKYNHLNKTELVEDKGYQLFHIFENEWLEPNKQQIWKSVINSKLNNTNRLFARKCDIKELNSNESNHFIEQNHLQGKCASSIRLGLYYQNELVSVMTFGKSRYNKSVQYELIRFCSKLNTTVVGGASRLLKYFELNYKPESIISYANRRWSTGNLYDKLGFEFSHNSLPNYFYFTPKHRILYSRNKFQKHKLKEKLKLFDSELTETENMYNNKYRKIYDSGNKVYIKHYN